MGAVLISQTFDEEPDDEEMDDANTLFAYAVHLRQQGLGTRAERLFRRGMVLHQNFVDNYGGPAFRKELVRTLLAQGEWAKAKQLYPSSDNPGGATWHHILVARAHSQHGEAETARKWWKLVLEHSPSNGEALNYVSISE